MRNDDGTTPPAVARVDALGEHVDPQSGLIRPRSEVVSHSRS